MKVFGYHLVGRHSVWQQGAFNIGLDLQQLLGFCRGSLRGLSGGTWVFYTLLRCSARKLILRAGEKLDLFLELAIGREMYIGHQESCIFDSGESLSSWSQIKYWQLG